MSNILTDIQNQLFENTDDLEVIMAQGGPISEAHIDDGDQLLVDVKRKAEHKKEVQSKKLNIQTRFSFSTSYQPSQLTATSPDPAHKLSWNIMVVLTVNNAAQS